MQTSKMVLAFLAVSGLGSAGVAGEKGTGGGWAAWVNQYRAQHGCSGQVTTKDSLSHYLYSLSRSAKGVLEVGAWRGCGSTLVIAKGLIDGGNGAKLTTFETHAERAKEATEKTRGLPVTVIHGPAAAADAIYPENELMSGALPPAMRASERMTYRKWWNGEQAQALLLQQAGVLPSVQLHCSSREIDVAFLDGGEFFGMADLQSVLRHCAHLRYIALDDLLTFKNDRPARQLSADDSAWTLCQESRTERHGWAIFVRKNASVAELKPCTVGPRPRANRLAIHRG